MRHNAKRAVALDKEAKSFATGMALGVGAMFLTLGTGFAFGIKAFLKTAQEG